jgi:hypothetical protein
MKPLIQIVGLKSLTCLSKKGDNQLDLAWKNQTCDIERQNEYGVYNQKKN